MLLELRRRSHVIWGGGTPKAVQSNIPPERRSILSTTISISSLFPGLFFLGHEIICNCRHMAYFNLFFSRNFCSNWGRSSKDGHRHKYKWSHFWKDPLFYRTHPFRPSLVRRRVIFQIKQPSIFTLRWQQRRLCSLFSRLLPSPIPKAQKVPQWSIHERECPKLCCVCWKAPKEKIARFHGEKKAVLFNIEMQTFIHLPNLAKAKIECKKKHFSSFYYVEKVKNRCLPLTSFQIHYSYRSVRYFYVSHYFQTRGLLLLLSGMVPFIKILF